jgi:hypothetical protein
MAPAATDAEVIALIAIDADVTAPMANCCVPTVP